jgi:hypothetical protein
MNNFIKNDNNNEYFNKLSKYILSLVDKNDNNIQTKKNIDLFLNLLKNKNLHFTKDINNKIEEIYLQNDKLNKIKNDLNTNINIDFSYLEDNWNNLNIEFGKIQLLTLIKKINDTDLNNIVDSITNSFEKKLTYINDLIEENLNLNNTINGGYINKYLKYKRKYLYLKNVNL